MQLTEIEKDFVDFFTERNGEPREVVLCAYLEAKNAIDLQGLEYRRYVDILYKLYAPYLSDRSEKVAIASYRHFAYLDILRFLSYSFPPKNSRRVARALRRVVRGDLSPLKRAFHATISEPKKTLFDLIDGPRRVLDYGSGGGQLSFQLAQRYPGTEVTLVDIDGISLDFTLWRFRKHGISADAVRVTPECVYPAELPTVDVCIANEVMEHLHEPLRAFEHIDAALVEGGILYGNFDDHGHEHFHVSPDLKDLREAVAARYEVLAPHVYRKQASS